MKAKSAGNAPVEKTYRGPDGNTVRQMFAGIAHRYDFLNHALSATIDRRWRRVAAFLVAEHVHHAEGMLCLDLCSGTGDLAIELHRQVRGPVIAADFCHPMLVRSLSKTAALRLENRIRTVESDALAIPFATGVFDAVTIAFGLRNLESPQKGLAEMRRVLKPDGILVILEFSQPVAPLFRKAFHFYFHAVLPKVGAWISGQKGAYRYLPASVDQFPGQIELASMIEKAGFRNVGYRNLSGGIAALHWGLK
jgi:demethylmenaquinone methyltransferase/2-methoxy-6-polyprenyl-1,4-benzoquinol methylase